MEAVVSILIPAIVENVFGALTEAVGLSDWLRQRLGRDPEKLAFHQALTQALTDSATHYPGRDLRYFAEILRDIGGPLLARTLQPAAPLPTAEELTNVWLNHLTVDSLIHYQGEFTQFATHFLDRLQFHLENKQPLHWITQARRERSSEETIRRMEETVEKSVLSLTDLRKEVADLNKALATTLQNSNRLTVNTEGGAYNAGTINAQNVSMRDLTIINNNYHENLPSSNPNKRSSNVVERWLLQSIETLSDRLSNEVERHLEEVQNAWREGRKTEASKWLSDLRNDNTSWIALSDETIANILCFEARLCLHSGDLERAKQLVQEAISLAPSSRVARVQALIIFHENGPAPALELLPKDDDIDSMNLRAILLLEQGDVKGSIALLDDPKFTKLGNAETLRIRSLAYLLSRNVAQAQLEIQKAVELAPRWEIIRETSALVNYYSALSSVSINEQPASLPEPIAPIFLKSDNESRSRLRHAMRLFHELASNPEKSAKERVRLRIWEMASLANDPEQQQAAAVLCKQLLQEHPTEYAAIAWVIARGYEVDLQNSLLALEKHNQEATANIQIILGLVLCYFGSKRYKEAEQLLVKSKTLFDEHQAISTWAHWYVRSRLADNEQGNSELAIEDLKHGPHQREVGNILPVYLAQKTSDWETIAIHFKQIYAENRDPHALLSYCEALTAQSKWNEFAKIAEILIEDVGTGNVLEFAVKGIYNAMQYAYCIALLKKYSNLFSDGRLSKGMQYLHLDCQHALGILPAAITEAEKLLREEPTTIHILKLLSLYFESGDMKRLAVEARSLLTRTDVLPEHLLQVARLVQYEDRELAASLWKQVYSKNIPDDYIGMAIFLGYSLRLENSAEHRALIERLTLLSQEPKTGIFKKEGKDILPFLNERRQQNAEFQEKYQTGQLPIHVVSTILNWSLVRLYHATGDRIDKLEQHFPLFIRHGGKQLLVSFPDTVSNWRLNLDVTAVLLAEHLDILRKVESIYAPLYIPADLIPALTEMRDSLLHHQPSRLEAISNILNYVDQNRILTITIDPTLNDADNLLSEELGVEQIVLVKEAISSNGYVVDFLPITKRDFSGERVTLPTAVSNHIVNIRALMQVLWEEGSFDDDEYADTLDLLGIEGKEEASVTLPIVGAKLYCSNTIVELLAEVKLLSIVVEHFQVVLTRNSIEVMSAALRFDKQNQQAINWLDNLRDRISTGLGKGIYEILPSLSTVRNVEQQDLPTSMIEQSFQALLSFTVKENDILWIDDRFISAYSNRDGAPIVGINEILKALVTLGRLQEKKYYNKLIALRVANIHFIPLHTDEIMHHLKMARITNGKLIEANALRVIRCHVAKSLLYGRFLQRPPLPDKSPNPMGEIAYITELSRAIANSIKTVWIEFNQKEDECFARAEWLLSSLYLDYCTTRHLIWSNTEQNDLYFTAMSLTHLLECGFDLTDLDDSGSLSTRYYQWLDQRLLRKLCENNPLLPALISNNLKDLFRSVQKELSENFDSENFEYGITMGLQRHYKSLPEVIRREIRQDSDFMSSLGLIHLEVIELDGIMFSATDFYQAASVVINGESTTIETLEARVKVAFHPVSGDPPYHRFTYVHPQTNKNHLIEHEELAMLSRSPAWRETVLRRNRLWFDCNSVDFEQQVALIASTEDAIERIQMIKAWQDSSAANFYQQLEFKIRNRNLISVDDLIPTSLDGLVRHLRLSTNLKIGQPFKDDLEQAANDLIATEGLANAVLRLSSLPVALPKTIILVANRLSREDRRQLIKDLLLRTHSVIGKIHLVHLLLNISDQSSSFVRLSRWVVIRLLTETAKSEIEAFSTILVWVNDMFNSQLRFRELPARLRLSLVWIHTHHLINLFATSGTPMDWLRETFEHFKSIKIVPELFERDSQYWFDVAHPHRLNMLRLLLVGFSYSFDTHREYLTDQIKLLTASLAFMTVEDQQMPSIALLKNLSLANNSLDSFLNTDFAAAVEMLWGKDIAALFTHERLQTDQRNFVEDYLKQSSSIDDLSTWAWLGATTGDLPLSQELQEQLTIAIGRTNFATYFKIDAIKACIALRTASLRLQYIDDNAVHLYVRDQLIKAAQVLAYSYTSDHFRPSLENGEKSKEQIYFSLFEIALNITHANSNNNVPKEFSALLEQLLLILPSFPEITKPLLQRLYEDTPISISRHFSQLYVWSRTI